jgi:ubiquitin C-terminal hydrolase
MAFEASTSSWKTYLKFNDSIITDIFAGQLQSTVECLTCHEK